MNACAPTTLMHVLQVSTESSWLATYPRATLAPAKAVKPTKENVKKRADNTQNKWKSNCPQEKENNVELEQQGRFADKLRQPGLDSASLGPAGGDFGAAQETGSALPGTGGSLAYCYWAWGLLAREQRKDTRLKILGENIGTLASTHETYSGRIQSE
jgi:hypothetical protein